jgi:tetratricopeptide (TPR) repeat protein
MRNASIGDRWPALGFASALIAAWALYVPGLSGGFLFDDYPNLQALGAYGGVTDWRTLIAYLFAEGTGHDGRPLAFLSFLLDDFTWPSSATAFKATNVCLHLLTMVAAAYLALELARACNYDRRRQGAIAVIAMLIWGLHPLFVSTVLYIVQRMAILAALFVFFGLALFVRGRRLLSDDRGWPAYLTMTVALSVFTPLAYASKENGGLLPLLAIVIDATVLSQLPLSKRTKTHYRRWKAVFLYAPVAVIVGYLALTLPGFIDGYETRPFSLIERLLTQPRILVDYIGKLFIPRIQTSGLYNDYYAVSRSLLQPIGTLFCTVFLVLMTVLALRYRRRYSLVSFAVLFFVGGHAVESSIVPLDLYYEHRNYLPAFGIAFAGAAGLTTLPRRYAVSSVVVIVCILAIFTAGRAQLWGNKENLLYVWAEQAPMSPRAQQNAAAIAVQKGHGTRALRYLDRGLEHNPNNTILALQKLAVACSIHDVTVNIYRDAQTVLTDSGINSTVVQNLKTLTDHAVNNECEGLPPARVHRLLDVVLSLDLPDDYLHDIWRYKGRLYLSQGHQAQAVRAFRRALPSNKSLPATMRIVGLLASNGAPRAALKFLNIAEHYVHARHEKMNLVARMTTSPIDYQAEIERIRRQLQERAAPPANPGSR